MEDIIHHHLIDKLAFFNGIISGVALYPQVWAVLHGGDSENLSVSTFILILINSIVWVLYALHRRLISLAIASLLNIIASAILIFAIIYF